jgi:hypothetical protein
MSARKAPLGGRRIDKASALADLGDRSVWSKEAKQLYTAFCEKPASRERKPATTLTRIREKLKRSTQRVSYVGRVQPTFAKGKKDRRHAAKSVKAAKKKKIRRCSA